MEMRYNEHKYNMKTKIILNIEIKLNEMTIKI